MQQSIFYKISIGFANYHIMIRHMKGQFRWNILNGRGRHFFEGGAVIFASSSCNCTLFVNKHLWSGRFPASSCVSPCISSRYTPALNVLAETLQSHFKHIRILWYYTKKRHRSVLFNRGSAKHVVGFREGSSFFRDIFFCFSMLMRQYEFC